MFDLVRRTPWQQLFDYFARGNPPIIIQILILNGIFFIWFASRRMRNAKPLRKETASTIQSLLLAINMVAVFQDNIRHIIHGVF
jgi:hypothetical protein